VLGLSCLIGRHKKTFRERGNPMTESREDKEKMSGSEAARERSGEEARAAGQKGEEVARERRGEEAREAGRKGEEARGKEPGRRDDEEKAR
jgi:hypothetical protein